VSVAEFRGAGRPDPDDAYGEPVDQRFGDRTPPQDHAAEQSVLGAMLLSKDAIADVVEAVRGSDFYRPVHETIFDAVWTCTAAESLPTR
jgi:replicative DNA helicase